MKPYLLSSIAALAALASSASFAADLPSRKVAPTAPAMTPVTNWSGIYIGGHAGYAWNSVGWNHVETNGAGGAVLTNEAFSVSPNSFAGGIHGGVQYQFSNNIVLGIEADYTWQNAGGNGYTDLNGFSRIRTADIGNLWSISGRLGYAFGDFLPYVKVGYAGTEISYQNLAASTGRLLGSSNSSVGGYVLGLGLEYSFTQNISAAIEYNYYNFSVGNQIQYTPTGAYGAINTNNDLTTNTVMAKLNYRFKTW